jgi:hypothetical protein
MRPERHVYSTLTKLVICDGRHARINNLPKLRKLDDQTGLELLIQIHQNLYIMTLPQYHLISSQNPQRDQPASTFGRQLGDRQAFCRRFILCITRGCGMGDRAFRSPPILGLNESILCAKNSQLFILLTKTKEVKLSAWMDLTVSCQAS